MYSLNKPKIEKVYDKLVAIDDNDSIMVSEKLDGISI